MTVKEENSEDFWTAFTVFEHEIKQCPVVGYFIPPTGFL
jgi:hypothetical protein